MLKLLQTNKPFIFCFLYSVIYFILWNIFRPIPSIDVAENFFWGQEFQLGYYKHPPFFAFFSGIVSLIIKPSVISSYFISSIFIFFSFSAFYLLAKEFLSKKQLITSIILLTSLSICTIKFRTFNANTAQVPFWILSVLFYLKGMEKKSYLYFSLFGFCLGMGFLSKYYTLILAFAIFVSFVSNKKHYQLLKTPLPYFSVIIFFITILPHIIWLFNNNFLPFQYAIKEQNLACSFWKCRIYPINTTLELIIALTPLIASYFYLFKNNKFNGFNFHDQKQNLLFYISILPSFLTIGILFIKGGFVKIDWLIPNIFFIPIFVLYFWSGELKNNFNKKLSHILYFFLLIWSAIIIITGIQSNKKLGNRYHSFKELSIKHTKLWEEEFNRPLKFIAGNTRDAGTFFLNSKTNPTVIPDNNLEFAKFINKVELKENGYLLLQNCNTDQLCIELNKGDSVREIKKIKDRKGQFYVFVIYKTNL